MKTETTSARDQAFADWCHRLWNCHPHAKPPRWSFYDQSIPEQILFGPEYDAPPMSESQGRQMLHDYPVVDRLLASYGGGPYAVLIYAGLSAAEIQAWDLHSKGDSFYTVAKIMHRDQVTVRHLVEKALYRLASLLGLEEAAGMRQEEAS